MSSLRKKKNLGLLLETTTTTTSTDSKKSDFLKSGKNVPLLSLKRFLRQSSSSSSKLLKDGGPSKYHTIIPSKSIRISKELGVGEFGIVQQGVWISPESSGISRTHQVAIKCLSKERMQNNTLEFMKEYDIMASIEHPHIVKLHGVVLDSPSIYLITELAPLRSLLECLKEPSLRTILHVKRLTDFCVQITEGMKYLESQRLIHRDLAARNLLVFSKDKVKISDFGLSRALGVGKDYYVTHFNANLKLPIAWCAPECINFLKFTTASDVWAFGVTMWEMFTYGFQPWAGQTGQQILDAIDKPKSLRLEMPTYASKEIYNIMTCTWKHEPNERPSFAELASLLEEAIPEQVQVVVSSSDTFYSVGDIITVLDKSISTEYWKGCLANGKVGNFIPSHTVAYIGHLPHREMSQIWRDENSGQRNSFRDKKQKKKNKRAKKISLDMISSPKGDVSHTGHVGADGAYFGDVMGFHNPSSSGPKRLSRTDSDASERAPLLSSSRMEVANKNPRMVYATGYLRKSSSEDKHEYQSISDDDNDEEDEEELSPLDLGPSLLDEVFHELEDSQFRVRETQKEKEIEEALSKETTKKHENLKEDFKDLVFSTLSRNRSKGKKQATVKPINAADERTLENAIAMANALASKSMHELDKDFYELSPSHSTPNTTPNSPSKKFSFWFPSSKSSPKYSERKIFSEAFLTSDAESFLSPSAKDAYKALIEDGMMSKASHRLSLPQSSNPLPLPPKTFKSQLAPAKRHVRKNPLIIPSGTTANLLRRDYFDIGKIRTEEVLSSSFHDFEESIACSMDALDHISPETPPVSHVTYNQDHVSVEDLLEFRRPQRSGFEDSDELRILKKVLGEIDETEGIQALQSTHFNVHHAIKYFKIKNHLNSSSISSTLILETLISQDWDIDKAAEVIRYRTKLPRSHDL